MSKKLNKENFTNTLNTIKDNTDLTENVIKPKPPKETLSKEDKKPTTRKKKQNKIDSMLNLSKREIKSTKKNYLFTPTLYEKFETKCKENGVSQNSVINDLVTLFVDGKL